MAANLTGVQSIWGDMNLGSSTQQSLSEAEQLARKKKMMAAGTSNEMQTATQFMFGNRLNTAGNPMA